MAKKKMFRIFVYRKDGSLLKILPEKYDGWMEAHLAEHKMKLRSGQWSHVSSKGGSK